MVSNIWVAAADNELKTVVEYLDSGKFTLNSKDPNGYTPIHAAASYGHVDLLRLLISRGGDINIQDNEGDSPLHHVEDLNTAKIMISEFNADYKLKNNDGQTPADYIEEDDEHPELVIYLRSLAHDNPSHNDSQVDQDSFLASLPAPGNIDGHQIRYTMQNDELADCIEIDEETRRKRIEAILESENPEEALRDLVRNAVQEGMSKYKEEQAQNEESQSSKRRR